MNDNQYKTSHLVYLTTNIYEQFSFWKIKKAFIILKYNLAHPSLDIKASNKKVMKYKISFKSVKTFYLRSVLQRIITMPMYVGMMH